MLCVVCVITERTASLEWTRKPSISRRNRIHWHYVRDDALFSTIKVVSRHQATQQYGAILPLELTTNEIRNSKAYQEYHACAMGEATPKPKASARKKKGTGEGTGSKPGVPDVPSDDSEEELSWKSSEDEEVGGQEEGNETNDDSDDGSDKDSEETVKSGAGQDMRRQENAKKKTQKNYIVTST
uniref:Uncharacterized protein n=1 Tax=Tanacetum cinerariifolium TaxID=118510 RepID=A0A6L2KLQ4_TANCI|nr:hypothetical protein [Tanacetum cinerariifolium]